MVSGRQSKAMTYRNFLMLRWVRKIYHITKRLVNNTAAGLCGMYGVSTEESAWDYATLYGNLYMTGKQE